MVKVNRARVTVSGNAIPAHIYVPVQVGTALLSSSDRVTVNVPGGERPTVVEVRENSAGTFQPSGSGKSR